MSVFSQVMKQANVKRERIRIKFEEREQQKRDETLAIVQEFRDKSRKSTRDKRTANLLQYSAPGRVNDSIDANKVVALVTELTREHTLIEIASWFGRTDGSFRQALAKHSQSSELADAFLAYWGEKIRRDDYDPKLHGEKHQTGGVPLETPISKIINYQSNRHYAKNIDVDKLVELLERDIEKTSIKHLSRVTGIGRFVFRKVLQTRRMSTDTAKKFQAHYGEQITRANDE